MPTADDWELLNNTAKKFYDYTHINASNAQNVNNSIIIDNKSLFHILLSNEYYAELNTLASAIVFFTPSNFNLICQQHHQLYCNLISILCYDEMIIYFEKIFNDDPLNVTNSYRDICSIRLKQIKDNQVQYPIFLQLIDEFNYLHNNTFERFYEHCKASCIDDPLSMYNINNIIIKFTNSYEKYTEFIPIIYRCINEYYIEYLDYQIQQIIALYGNSNVLLIEYYNNILKCISNLPMKYVDCRFINAQQQNILFTLAKMPKISGTDICDSIYTALFDQVKYIDLNIMDDNSNNILQIMVNFENEIMIKYLLKWINDNNMTSYISAMVYNKNIWNKTLFDIIIDKNNYDLMSFFDGFIPEYIYVKLTNRLIEDISLGNQDVPLHFTVDIYFKCIDYFIDELKKLHSDILYDLSKYNMYRINVSKLIKIIFHHKTTDINKNDTIMTQLVYWLVMCIDIDDIKLFSIILNNAFIGTQMKHYLDMVVVDNNTLISYAVKNNKYKFINKLLKHNINIHDAVLMCIAFDKIDILKIFKNYLITNECSDHNNQLLYQAIDNYLNLSTNKCNSDPIIKNNCILCKIKHIYTNYVGSILDKKC